MKVITGGASVLSPTATLHRHHKNAHAPPKSKALILPRKNVTMVAECQILLIE